MAATWGITTTTNASPADILRFTKHYAALGATQIDIYLDEPPDSLESLKEAPAISNFIMCTNKYWHDIKGSRPENLVSRQIANATRSYRMARFGWLGHVDTDELIMCNPPFWESLAQSTQEH
ncbi:glycosyltransferase family 2 protein [Mesobacterium pallidum]|uniref:glycosyltransferase family 2 protein n=1 Tax=Mesobacterium pallidum TaxID=2872037 RepID=UPI003AB974EE